MYSIIDGGSLEGVRGGGGSSKRLWLGCCCSSAVFAISAAGSALLLAGMESGMVAALGGGLHGFRG